LTADEHAKVWTAVRDALTARMLDPKDRKIQRDLAGPLLLAQEVAFAYRAADETHNPKSKD